MRQLITIITTVVIFSMQLSAHADIKVGIDPSYKPLAFIENGEMTGIEVATANELGKELNEKIEFVTMPFDNLIPALQSDKIDVIMSGMSMTEERKAIIDYSNSYLEIGQMAIIRTKDAAKFSAPRAIFSPGVKVGVQMDTTGNTFADQYLISATIKQYNSADRLFAALRSGEIDFMIHDAPTSWELAQTSEYSDLLPLYRPLTRESLAWAVKKGNTELLNKLNNWTRNEYL